MFGAKAIEIAEGRAGLGKTPRGRYGGRGRGESGVHKAAFRVTLIFAESCCRLGCGWTMRRVVTRQICTSVEHICMEECWMMMIGGRRRHLLRCLNPFIMRDPQPAAQGNPVSFSKGDKNPCLVLCKCVYREVSPCLGRVRCVRPVRTDRQTHGIGSRPRGN